MGFFSGEEAEVKQVPVAGWQKKGINWILDLLERPAPEFPTAPVAGMTPTEEMAQGVLANLLGGGAFEDPRTSPLYGGLRAESMAEEERGVSALRRRGQAAGMYHSTPSYRAEGEYRGQMARGRESILGGLYESERARDNPYTRLAAVAAYGGLPRLLEQAGGEAGYQSELQRLMFPYTGQAPLAQSLMSSQPSYYMTSPQPSGFSQVLGGMQAASQMALPIMMMAGMGGGGAAAGGLPGGSSAAGTGSFMRNWGNMGSPAVMGW